MRLRDRSPAVPCRNSQAAADQRCASASIERRRHGSGNRRDVVGLAPQHVVIAEIFGERRDARGDDRDAARHRFEHDQAEAFLYRRKHQGIGGPIKCRHQRIGDRAGADYRVRRQATRRKRSGRIRPDRRHDRGATRRLRSPGAATASSHARARTPAMSAGVFLRSSTPPDREEDRSVDACSSTRRKVKHRRTLRRLRRRPA